MLKISSSHFLFIMEILVVTVGIAIFFFIQNRKLKSRLNDSKRSAEKRQKELQDESVEKAQKELQNKSAEETQKELQKQAQAIAEASEWKEKLENLQKNFDQVKAMNIRLKELIGYIMPEADRSEDMQKLLSGTDLSKQDLDACIGKVKEEMKGIGEQAASNTKEVKSHEKEAEAQKEEITQLKRKLENSVKKATHESMKTEKERLDFMVGQLDKQLKEKTEAFEKLEKEHTWLEEEYNRMYDNLDEEQEGSPDHAAAGQPAEG